MQNDYGGPWQGIKIKPLGVCCVCAVLAYLLRIASQEGASQPDFQIRVRFPDLTHGCLTKIG